MTNIHFWSYLAHFFLEWEMFQINLVEKIKTRILYSVNFFPRKSSCLWDNAEKSCRAVQATDDNTAHAHCMLDNYGYKYTHSGCVILIAFFSATMVARKRPNVMLYVHCPSCSFFHATPPKPNIHIPSPPNMPHTRPSHILHLITGIVFVEE